MNAATVIARIPELTGVYGFIDGLSLEIQGPGDVLEHNAYYNDSDRLLVFDAFGVIIWARYNSP